MIRRWQYIYGAALVLTAVTIAALAFAHGAASWIMQDPSTRWCCGPTDCKEDWAGRFVPIGRGTWQDSLTGKAYRLGDPDVYPSIDSEVWYCEPEGWPEPKCVFLPTGEVG